MLLNHEKHATHQTPARFTSRLIRPKRSGIQKIPDLLPGTNTEFCHNFSILHLTVLISVTAFPVLLCHLRN